MPVSSAVTVTLGVPLRISEVNPRRETLTIINISPFILALADDDAPFLADGRLHGIPIYPNTSLTLEREDGDQPDKAWYIYSMETTYILVFEGMTPKKERWW